MACRLRHVQSVTLKRFEPGRQLHRDEQLFYELWRSLPDGSQQLLYVSEQVPLDFDLCWQPLSAARCCVPAEQLHMPFGDPLHLTIKAVQPNAAANPAAAAADPVDAVQAAVGHGAGQFTAAQGAECADEEQQVLVRYIGSSFRVLLPRQLQELEQQQQQQREQQDKAVSVLFDAAAGRFKVVVNRSAAAAVARHASKQQSTPQQQQPAQAGGEQVRLAHTNGRWQLHVTATDAAASSPTKQSAGQTQQLPPQSPPPPLQQQKQQQQQQQQQAVTAQQLRQGSALSAETAGQLTPLRQQQQQHICSQAVPATVAAAGAASPSHAAMLRARQVRHSRSGSSSSDAALQLEQQLLGVFTMGSISGGRQRSSMGGAGPGIVANLANLLQQPGQPMNHSVGGAAVDSGAVPAQVAQQQQGEQDVGNVQQAQDRADSGSLQQHELASFAGMLELPLQAARGSAAAASHPGPTYQQPSSSQHSREGKVVLHFGFWVHDLCPCDPQELKTPLPGSQHSAEQQQQQRNKLLLQLTGGLYTLPPRPLSPEPQEVPQLSPMASGEEWVGAEGFDSLLRLGLTRQQLSGHMAAVAQQQQLYRWMQSSSTGILDSLEHSYDEDEHAEQMAQAVGHHRRGSSTGSALSLLGSLFNRLNPSATAAAAAGTAATAAVAEGLTSPAGAAPGALQATVAAAGQQTLRQPSLPSVASAGSLAEAADSPTAAAAAAASAAAGGSNGSSPQCTVTSIGGGSPLPHGSSPGSFASSGGRHRRTGSSTATSTALGVGSILGPGVGGSAAPGHRRAQSVSSGGASWTLPYPKAPLSPSGLAPVTTPASAAAAAVGAGAVNPAAAGGGAVDAVSSAISSPAAAQPLSTAPGTPSFIPAVPSTSNSSHSRLADSFGGSSAAAAAAAPPPPPAVAAAATAAGGLPGLLQRGFLLGFSFWDWGSGDDSVGLAAGGTAAERAAVERQYEVDEFVAATKRLVTLYQRLHHVQDRRDRIRYKVESLLKQQAVSRDQQQRRHMAQQRQQAAARMAALRQQQLGQARAELHAQKEHLLARCEGVTQAAGALAQASDRLRDASAVLEGGEGLGRWKQLHGQLVARRNRLVAELGEAFEVGPASKSPFAAAPLALQLDASWWAVDADTAADAASDTGEQQQRQQGATALLAQMQQPGGMQQPQVATSVMAVMPPHWLQQQQQQQLQASPQLQQQQQHLTQQQQQQQGSPSVPGPPSPVVDRLLVGGLELPATLAKRGLQGSMGWGGDLDEEARVAAALGYVAHIVSLLSVYLDVPLRYPLIPRSSRSVIIDPAPVHSQSLETHVHRRFWGMAQAAVVGGRGSGSGGGGGASNSPRGGDASSSTQQQQQQQQQNDVFDSPIRVPAAAPAGQPGAVGAIMSPGKVAADVLSPSAAAAGAEAASDAALQLPLFYVTGDRTRFAYAVFLLNKDIEQLLHVHGMSSQGPSQVLANLYKLITAAVSGLPQQQQGPGPSVSVAAILQPRRQQQGPQHQGAQQQGGGVGRQGARQVNGGTPAAGGAAEAAVVTAGAGAVWLQQLPLPPSHKPEQQQQSGRQPLLQQPTSKLWQQQQQQSARQVPPQQQQQQRGGGSWWWPWQSDGQQQQATVPAASRRPAAQQQQQQQQPVAPSIATWDWNELLGQAPEQQQVSQQPQHPQQQQQQQHAANGNGNAAFDLHSWQQENDAQLQAAQQAAAAAEAAAAAAEKAMDVAAKLMQQEGSRGCGREQQQQQQQRQDGRDAAMADSRSVASLLSLKWAGDG